MKRLTIVALTLSLTLAFPACAQSSYSGSKSYSPRSPKAYSSQRYGGRNSTQSPRNTNSRNTNVRSYTRKNGTNVQAHQRSAPNNARRNSYSAKGRVNAQPRKSGIR